MSPDASLGSAADGILVGWAEVDITPPLPTLLWGQMYQRVAHEAHDPVTATVLAVVAPETGEQVTMISLDLCFSVGILEPLRRRLVESVSGLDAARIFAFATHTHTAPYLIDQEVAPEGVMNGSGYLAFLLDRLEPAVQAAWADLSPGRVGWAEGRAEVGFCRVVVYDNGVAEINGNPAAPNFLEMECPNDPRVGLVYFWDEDEQLRGVVINVASTAQVVDTLEMVSADYWHRVREMLRAQPELPSDLFVLPMCGAAGDQTPRNLEEPSPEQEGWAGVDRVALRLTETLVANLEGARSRASPDPILRHSVRAVSLPERPEHGGVFSFDLHAVRLGEFAIVSNPFELYVEYGLLLAEARSAPLTLLAQLSGDVSGGYLPTERAVANGAYGSRAENGRVGPEGGAELIRTSVEEVRGLFE